MPSSRAYVIAQVIKSLPPPPERVKAIKDAEGKPIDEAMNAAREAIDQLDEERAGRLSAAEAAVCLRIGYRSAIDNLRAYRKQHERGKHWHQVAARVGEAPKKKGTSETVSAKQARASKPAEFRYDRDSLKRWWKGERVRRKRAAGERAALAHARSRDAERARLDDLLAKLRRAGVSHDTILDQLQALIPWVVDSRGFIVDSLALPQRTAPELAQTLATGRGEAISLFDAVTAWQWDDDTILAPWHHLFLRLLKDAERAAAVTRLKISERAMRGK